MSHIEKYYRDQLAEAEEELKFFNESLEFLKNDEKIQEFFSKYNPASIDSFMNSYALHRYRWKKHGESFYQLSLTKKYKHRDKAIDLLREIYYKKIFNLLCQWATGEIDIEGVDVPEDLYDWSISPELHPLINPITDEEIQCYLDYRAIEWEKEEWDRTPRLVLEHYHLFKIHHGDDADNQLCDWFEFYDKRFGTKALMHLPILRLEALDDYHDIWCTEIYYPTLSEEDQKTIRRLNRHQREYFREHPEEKKIWEEESNRLWEEREAKREKYEHLSTYDNKLMKEIVALVEDHNNQILCKYHKKWHEDNPTDDFELELSIGELNADGVEIEENDDWKTAVKTAAELNEERKTNEALLKLIDEYKKARDAGEIFSMKYKGGHKTEISPSHKTIKERVLEARKFKGEPENFDFIKTENLFKK